jgi:hypothetical protein
LNTTKIISYIKDYQAIGNDTFLEVAALKKEYSWFATLYSLEAKCLKNQNKFGLKKSVKSASLFAGDREVLYDFLHNEINFEGKGKSPIVKTPEVKPAQTVQPIITSKPKVEAEVEVVTKVEVKNDKSTENAKKPTPTPVIKPAPKPIVKEKIVEKLIIQYDPLIELQSQVKDSADTKKVKKSKVYDPLVELPKIEKLSEKKTKDSHDFFGWLDSLDEDESIEAPKPRKLKMSAEASELLENFIKNRPSITRIRTDVERTEIHKVESEDNDSEIVTESLAQLHLKQDRPDEAIKIYRKLRLQNPQKFSYFAALIEKIEQDNNLT